MARRRDSIPELPARTTHSLQLGRISASRVWRVIVDHRLEQSATHRRARQDGGGEYERTNAAHVLELKTPSLAPYHYMH